MKPKPTLDEQRGLKDYWKIYEAHRTEIGGKLMQMARHHQEFKFILQNSAAHPLAEQQAASGEVQRRAIYYREWQPYIHTRLHLGDGYAGRAALSRQTIYVSDLQTRGTDFLRSPTFHQEGFVCYLGVPLIAEGEIRGVMEIFHRTALNPAKEWLEFMETLAEQVAIAIDNATLFKNLQLSNIQLTMAYDATIEGWSKALDLRDKETEGHTQRVTELAMRLARSMGDGILLKPGALTEEEWTVMKKHPVFAYEMLAPIQYLHSALDIPYCHHEKWDGTGYPRGLKGEEIPLAARIFAVVDVYDALTSDRPYRPAWTKENALKHIRQGAGSHFEAQVAEKFISMIANDR